MEDPEAGGGVDWGGRVEEELTRWAASEDLPSRRTSPVVATTRAALSLSPLSLAPPPRVVELRVGSLPPTTIEQVAAAPDPSFPPYLARARRRI
jgi:hypothetical protein